MSDRQLVASIEDEDTIVIADYFPEGGAYANGSPIAIAITRLTLTVNEAEHLSKLLTLVVKEAKDS